jgi:hypothetical protein
MKFLRPLLTFLVLIVVAGIGFVWWSWPGKSDLTEYAPADAVVYIEVNSLTDIADSLRAGDVWKAASVAIKGETPTPPNGLLRSAARAGIGPAAGVLLSRSQLALIVLSMNTTEEENSLKVKPEFALIVETHTSNWRTKPVAKEAIQKLATMIYGAASCAERSNAGTDFFECGGATPERKIVAAIEGSLIVIGNTEKAVQACLDVRRGARPSLKTNAELQQARAATSGNLAFGYVPRNNAPRLFAWAAPLFLGASVGETNIQKLLENSVSKMIGGISWTARAENGQVEDTFNFGLEPDVISQLQPVFVTEDPGKDFWIHVPTSVDSISLYRSQKPLTAWDSLNTSVALKLDAVQSVVIGTVLRSGLTSYGISNPREFMGTIKSPLLTFKPDVTADGSVLVTQIGSEETLRHYLNSDAFAEGKGQVINSGVEAKPDVEFTALLVGGWLIVGRTENVLAHQKAIREGHLSQTDKLASPFSSAGKSAAVVTVAKDKERVSSFVRVLFLMENYQLTTEKSELLKKTIGDSHFSFTQTSLTDSGLERKTRSAFGQFSTLTSVLDQTGSR